MVVVRTAENGEGEENMGASETIVIRVAEDVDREWIEECMETTEQTSVAAALRVAGRSYSQLLSGVQHLRDQLDAAETPAHLIIELDDGSVGDLRQTFVEGATLTLALLESIREQERVFYKEV